MERVTLDDTLAERVPAARRWTKRGRRLVETGDLRGGLTCLDQALRLHAYVPALIARGRLLLRLGEYDAAAQDCTKLLELTLDLPEAWLIRGVARAQLGATWSAEDDLYHYLSRCPRSPYLRLARRCLEGVRGGEGVRVRRERPRRWRRQEGPNLRLARMAKAG